MKSIKGVTILAAFMRSIRSLTILAAFLVLHTAAVAQLSELPFGPGETLAYEAKVSKVIRGIAVADMIFTVARADGNDDRLLIKADARSKGTLLKLARYSFLQELQSIVGINDFRVFKTVKHDVQKERIRNSEAVFEYGERRVTYTETDPNEPLRPPRRIASEVDSAAHDLVSAIYHLRLLPLAVGRTFVIKLSDSGLVYDIPVKVTARERQSSIFGNLMSFRIEPAIFGPGRLIEREGSMIIWITDDARRLPIRSQVNSWIGKVEIKLRSAKNLK